MSLINGKPYITTVLESLTRDEIQTLKKLVNGLGDGPEFYSLIPQSPYLLSPHSSDGVIRVRLETGNMTQSIYNGYLIYKNFYRYSQETPFLCVLIAYSGQKNQELTLINIEKNNGLFKYNIIDCDLTILELRSELDDAVEIIDGDNIGIFRFPYYEIVRDDGYPHSITAEELQVFKSNNIINIYDNSEAGQGADGLGSPLLYKQSDNYIDNVDHIIFSSMYFSENEKVFKEIIADVNVTEQTITFNISLAESEIVIGSEDFDNLLSGGQITVLSGLVKSILSANIVKIKKESSLFENGIQELTLVRTSLEDTHVLYQEDDKRHLYFTSMYKDYTTGEYMGMLFDFYPQNRTLTSSVYNTQNPGIEANPAMGDNEEPLTGITIGDTTYGVLAELRERVYIKDMTTSFDDASYTVTFVFQNPTFKKLISEDFARVIFGLDGGPFNNPQTTGLWTTTTEALNSKTIGANGVVYCKLALEYPEFGVSSSTLVSNGNNDFTWTVTYSSAVYAQMKQMLSAIANTEFMYLECAALVQSMLRVNSNSGNDVE